jgi:zinc protease
MFLMGLLMMVSLSLFGQGVMPLPVDPKVRTGKLDNGLTYYIRHNEYPKDRANFYIAQQVGSVLEEENQRGLAHFLEHMAFNGTKNLPGKMLLNYMESIGVKFGENINAGTGWDETIYMLMDVPIIREGIIDTSLLILHDWSSFISLENEEIDKERGVIHEEWRSRSDAQMRIYEQLFPTMFEGSQYAHRFPIGTMDVVLNFKYQELKDYYHKWYRPDLQGLVIVGDIDVDQIEAKIKNLFSDISAPVDPAERIYYPVPDNVEPIVVTATDKEAPYTSVMLFYKHESIPREMKNSAEYYMLNYMTEIIGMMLNQRLEEITQKPNAPFLYAYVYDGDFLVAKTVDAWTNIVIVKEGGIEEGLRAMIMESERVQRHGFTASEYERAKADFLKRIESLYDNRETQKNEIYTEEYVNSFIDGEPIPGIEMEYMLYNQIASMVSVEMINQVAKELVGEENLVVTVTGPEKEGLTYPSKEALLKIIEEVEATQIDPYVDAVSDEPLITEDPKPGTIKSEKKLEEFDAIEWTLSNGAKVIIKPTKFKEDEVLMNGFSWGGSSVLPLSDVPTSKMLNDLAMLGGLGNFSATDLPKVLAGKKASVDPHIVMNSDNISGSCSPKDFETMMQLTYLSFTQPRSDDEAFEAFVSRTKAMLEAQEINPMITFVDTMNSVVYNNHPLAERVKAKDIDKINYKRAMEIYKDRYSDIQNFTFVFVGNIEPDAVRNDILKYIGSIAPTKRKETWKDTGREIVKKDVVCQYDKQMEIPMSTVVLLYSGDYKYSHENAVLFEALTDILDIVYTEKIREDEGGTYGVGVNGGFNRIPKETFSLQIFFQTNVDAKDKLIKIAIDEVNAIAENGPRKADVLKVKENLLKKFAEDKHENKYWSEVLATYVNYNQNNVKDYESIVNKISVESIQKLAKDVLKNAYKKEIVQNPKQ